MPEYTPSIDDLCEAYVQAQLGADGYSAEEREAEFYRGLAAHDWEVAAEAVRQAAADLPAIPHRDQKVWLYERADRIADNGGGQS